MLLLGVSSGTPRTVCEGKAEARTVASAFVEHYEITKSC